MFAYENNIRDKGYSTVIGVDEAGRGPLAGPVVAAAVNIRVDDQNFHSKITDSKKISENQRKKAFQEIIDKADVGVGIVNAEVIDQKNILQATFLAMTKAINNLLNKIESQDQNIYLLIDGNQFKSDLPYKYDAIVKGDSLITSISCASIIAKVVRDHILKMYNEFFPEYEFARHKGYPTKAHKEVLHKLGHSIVHRKTFRF